MAFKTTTSPLLRPYKTTTLKIGSKHTLETKNYFHLKQFLGGGGKFLFMLTFPTVRILHKEIWGRGRGGGRGGLNPVFTFSQEPHFW